MPTLLDVVVITRLRPENLVVVSRITIPFDSTLTVVLSNRRTPSLLDLIPYSVATIVELRTWNCPSPSNNIPLPALVIVTLSTKHTPTQLCLSTGFGFVWVTSNEMLYKSVFITDFEVASNPPDTFTEDNTKLSESPMSANSVILLPVTLLTSALTPLTEARATDTFCISTPLTTIAPDVRLIAEPSWVKLQSSIDTVPLDITPVDALLIVEDCKDKVPLFSIAS